MATTTLTLTGERWLDQVVLSASVADVAGAALSESFLLPAGLGDVAIMSLHARVDNIDVIATLTNLAAAATIVTPDASTVVERLGPAKWYETQNAANDLEAQCTWDPDALVLWRQGEILNVTSSELDTDATPTADLRIFVKAVRVRPIEGTQSVRKSDQEFRLTR